MQPTAAGPARMLLIWTALGILPGLFLPFSPALAQTAAVVSNVDEVPWISSLATGRATLSPISNLGIWKSWTAVRPSPSRIFGSPTPPPIPAR